MVMVSVCCPGDDDNAFFRLKDKGGVLSSKHKGLFLKFAQLPHVTDVTF